MPPTARWPLLACRTHPIPAPPLPHCGAGSGGAASWPIGDRWLFDLSSREWRQLPIRGLSPLPRFLFSSAQLSPGDGAADQFVVFGGETGGGCKLNDVWRLGLDTLHWEQLSAPVFATRRCRQLFG